MSIFKETNNGLGDALQRKRMQNFDNDKRNLANAVGNDLARLIMPAINTAFEKLVSKLTVKVDAPKVTVPTPVVNVKAPIVNVPPAIVNVSTPEVRVPEIKIPNFDMVWPEGSMPVHGDLRLADYSHENPMSVQIRDENGKPVNLSSLGGTFVGGSGGGFAKQVKISNDSSNPVPVTLATTGTTASTAAALIDSSGEQYSGSNPLPVALSGAAGTSAVNVVDSTGEAYSGSNPFPVNTVDVSSLATSANQLPDGHNVTIDNAAGAAAVNIQDGGNTITVDGSGVTQPISGTVAVSGVTASVSANIVDSTGVGYSGSNPLPTLPTLSVRGNLKTAYVTEDEVQEVTLLAGVASEYHDMIMILGANESDAAINVDIRPTTGGTVLATLAIPANGTAGLALNNDAYPQPETDSSWTVQNNATDMSNTVYSITGLFKKVV